MFVLYVRTNVKMQDNQTKKQVGTEYKRIKKKTGWGEIFRTRPDRARCPPSLLCKGYLVSCPGVKRQGRGVNHPLPSNACVKERVELYLYSASGSSWPVLGQTLPFYLFTRYSSLVSDKGLEWKHSASDVNIYHLFGGALNVVYIIWIIPKTDWIQKAVDIMWRTRECTRVTCHVISALLSYP